MFSIVDVHRQLSLQTLNCPGILHQTALYAGLFVAIAVDTGRAHVHAELLVDADLTVFETFRTLIAPKGPFVQAVQSLPATLIFLPRLSFLMT